MVYVIQLVSRIRTEQQDHDGTASPSWSCSQFYFYMTLWQERHSKIFVGYTKYIFFISSIALSEIFLIVQIVDGIVVVNADRTFVMYDFKEIWISVSTDFQRSSEITFHEILWIGNRSVPWGKPEEQADRHYGVNRYFKKILDCA